MAEITSQMKEASKLLEDLVVKGHPDQMDPAQVPRIAEHTLPLTLLKELGTVLTPLGHNLARGHRALLRCGMDPVGHSEVIQLVTTGLLVVEDNGNKLLSQIGNLRKAKLTEHEALPIRGFKNQADVLLQKAALMNLESWVKQERLWVVSQQVFAAPWLLTRRDGACWFWWAWAWRNGGRRSVAKGRARTMLRAIDQGADLPSPGMAHGWELAPGMLVEVENHRGDFFINAILNAKVAEDQML